MVENSHHSFGYINTSKGETKHSTKPLNRTFNINKYINTKECKILKVQRLFFNMLLTNHSSGSSFIDSSNDSLRFVASIEFRVGSNFSNHIERFYF